ncbi:MAG: peptide-methionine (S)-S-oxide reductase MsrA [Geminicoccaceae bacterium]
MAGPARSQAPPTVGLLAAILIGLVLVPAAAQEGIAIPAPAVDEAPAAGGMEVAVLAGGCFWGVQGVFQRVSGVSNAVSGYAGGEADTAVYETVGSGQTGHAESVQITYDPAKISYGKLLQVFFSVAHDPTQLDRQGPDVGSQYRTAIFPANDEQAKIARAYIAQLDQARVFDAAIVTRIEPGRSFYPAEDYHQDFLTLNPNYPYIVYNDLPKIENLKRLFPDLYRDDPVLVSQAGLSSSGPALHQ